MALRLYPDLSDFEYFGLIYLIFKDLQTRVVQNHFASPISGIICDVLIRICMNYFLIWITFLLIGGCILCPVQAQQTQIDSIRAALPKSKPGSQTHINNLINIGKYYLSDPSNRSNLDSAATILKDALLQARTGNFSHEEADALSALATYSSHIQSYQEALNYYVKASERYQVSNDLNNIGGCYYHMGLIYNNKILDQQRSGYCFRKVITLKDHLLNKGEFIKVSNAYYYIGSNYGYTNQLDSSIYFLAKCIQISEIHSNISVYAYVSIIYANMGINDYGQAAYYARQLVSQAQKQQNKEAELWGYSSIGYIFQDLLNLPEAIINYQKAREIALQIGKNFDALQFEVCILVLKTRLYNDPKVLQAYYQMYDSTKLSYPCALQLWVDDLGPLFVKFGEYDRAMAIYEDLLQRAKTCNNEFHYAKLLSLKANLLLVLKKRKEALHLARKSYRMIQNADQPALLYEIKEVLGRAEYLEGNKDTAEMLFQQVRAHKDSIQRVRLQALAKFVTDLENEKSQIVILSQENNLLKKDQQNRYLLTALLAVGVLSLIVILLILLDRNRISRKTQALNAQINQQLDALILKINASEEGLSEGLREKITAESMALNAVRNNLTHSETKNDSQEKIKALDNIIAQQTEVNQRISNIILKKNEELRAFNYTVSHDLKSPLGNIDNILDMLSIQPSIQQDALALQFLQDAKASNLLSQEMIHGISAYAEADNLPLQYHLIPTNQLIDRMIRTLSPPPTYQISVAELPNIHADEFLMRQVFLNILSNAIKFTKLVEQPQISVTGKRTPSVTEIMIQDNGVGIPVEKVGAVFQLFKSAHNRKEFPGSGVGLAIVRRIIERHHGDISIRNAQGKGCIVTITLPNHPTNIV